MAGATVYMAEKLLLGRARGGTHREAANVWLTSNELANGRQACGDKNQTTNGYVRDGEKRARSRMPYPSIHGGWTGSSCEGSVVSTSVLALWGLAVVRCPPGGTQGPRGPFEFLDGPIGESAVVFFTRNLNSLCVAPVICGAAFGREVESDKNGILKMNENVDN